MVREKRLFRELRWVLERLGFNVRADGNGLEAAKEEGDRAVEISVDLSGWTLVTVRSKRSLPESELDFSGGKFPITTEAQTIQKVRVAIHRANELLEALDKLNVDGNNYTNG